MQFRTDSELPSSGGSKNYLKLKDKESVSGIFRGSIHEFFIVWENGKSRTVSEGTPEGKFRFKVNFVTKEGTQFVPKIFEQGIILYKQLAELHKEYNLEETVVKLSRSGTGTDTTYSLLPLLKTPLTKDVIEQLNQLELLPLEGKAPASDEPALPF